MFFTRFLFTVNPTQLETTKVNLDVFRRCSNVRMRLSRDLGAQVIWNDRNIRACCEAVESFVEL